MPRLLLLGAFDAGRLETSYSRAFRGLDWEVHEVSLLSLVKQEARLGYLGSSFQRYIHVEPWVRRINANLITIARQLEPDLVILVGMVEHVRAGAIAQIRAILPVKVAWIWPDTLSNLSTDMTTMLPVVDLVAAYSRSTLRSFSELGARKVIWLPLAADPVLHGSASGVSVHHTPCDVSFIGGWRPSREEFLSTLGGFELRIWGNDWGPAARRNAVIRRAWQKASLVGADFASEVRASRINLNLIDPTNYPAANMRVFELLMAGGFQLSTECPELGDVLRNDEHLLYFDRARDLPELVSGLLQRSNDRQRMADAGHHEVANNHTYADRARSLSEACGIG